MNIVYIILIVIVVIFLIIMFFDITKYKLDGFTKKISLVEDKIDFLLDIKYNNIIKIDEIIKEKIQTEKEIIDDIESLKSDDKSKSEIDFALEDALPKIEYIKDQYDELENEEELNNLFTNINTNNETLTAYKKFYDDNVKEYNKIINSFPYNITAKLFKHSNKKLFEPENE